MIFSLRSRTACWATVVLAAGFETATVAVTQVPAVRLRSPWQDDPYDTVISVALVAVPVLAVLTAVRLVLHVRADDGRSTRAALTITAVVGLVSASEWSAVATGAHRARWNAGTAGLVAVLASISVAVAILAVEHLRHLRASGHGSGRGDADWLDDLVMLTYRLPGHLDLAAPAAWIRRRALTVFAAGSLVGGMAVAGSLAYVERWSDPWLVAWAVGVATTSNLLLCLVGNAAIGVVRRPPGRYRHLEVCVATACLSVQLAVAFHAPIWTALTGHEPHGVGALGELTLTAAVLGAGLAVPWAARARRRRPAGNTG